VLIRLLCGDKFLSQRQTKNHRFGQQLSILSVWIFLALH